MEKYVHAEKWGKWKRRIDTLPCVTFIGQYKEELRLVVANQAFYRMVGRTPEELRSKCEDRFGALVDEESLEKLLKIEKNGLTNDVPANLKLKFMRDKACIWVHTEVNCIDVPEGRILYCTAIDVTVWEEQRRFMDEFVKNSSFAMDMASVDLFSYDADSDVARIYFAKNVLPKDLPDVQGYCPDFQTRLMGMGIVNPASIEVFRDTFDRIATTEKCVCELRVGSDSKVTRWARLTLVRNSNVEGGFPIIGIMEDITEQRNATRNYLNETLLYQSMLAEQDAYAQVDMTKDYIERIGGLWRIYNEIIDRVTYSDLILEFINKVVHPDDRKMYSEFMQRENFINSLENGIDRLTCDFRRIEEQNKMVWMQIHAYLSREPMTGHIFALLCIKNINVQKQKEICAEALTKKAVGITLSDADPFDALVGRQGDIAYLVNPDNFDLICANQAMLDRLGLTAEECLGMKCYEAMQKRTTPCPFCGRANWSTDKFFMWKNLNLVLEQEFLIKNKLVQWQGKEALLALAIDISNDKSVVDSLENGTLESHSILVGVQRISEAETLADVMQSALETIGSFFRAEEVRLFRLGDERIYTAEYFWSRIGEIDKDKDIDATVNEWVLTRNWDAPILLESPESALCHSYDLYCCLKAHGIRNQRWMRITEGGNEQGFLCINNIGSNFQNVAFLESFTVFISSELRKRGLMEELQNAVKRDALTDLLSRNSFENFVGEYRPDFVDCMGVIVANMDNLARINSVRGFSTGNFYLCQFADMIRNTFPEANIYRLNGDEFLAIMSDMPQEEMQFRLVELEGKVKEYGHFNLSFGSSWDDIEKDLALLIEQATVSMKINKNVHHDAAPVSEDMERRKMLSELVSDIRARRYEVFLQPKVVLDSSEVMGAEALIRYIHPEQGIIPPAQFIESLEKANLIRYIDLFVFEEVCRLLEKWQARGVNPLPVVSLNFSRMTLQEQDILASVETIMKNYDVPRGNLEIEITESAANMGKSILYQTANDLYQAGFAISLDDFGTKYTNLSILADIEFSVLKLDRSLVDKLESQTKYQMVLRHVIHMCKELGIHVIAEGVETAAQKEILQGLGCELGQGYLFGKPIRVEDFENSFLE